MKDFPEFMKNKKNHIDSREQNTENIDGYFYEGADGSQMAFWTCDSDRVSQKHTHEFDEYMVCVGGQYTAIINDKEHVLNPGDELFIPKGTEQWGKCIAGTRTIHVFGGKRVHKTNDLTLQNAEINKFKIGVEQMLIREGVINDAHFIHMLNKEGLGYDYPEEKTKIKLQKILSMETDKIFVADINNNVVGYIHGSDYECSYSDSLKNILALVVDENYRKIGIGKKLMEVVENWAKQTGAAGVRLVSGYNREVAHKFYLNCGFILRKEQKNFIKWF